MKSNVSRDTETHIKVNGNATNDAIYYVHSHIRVLSALTFCVTIKIKPDILENVIRLKLHFARAYPSEQQCLKSLCLVAAVWFIFHLVHLSKK